ncbi:MAG: nucleoside triphosphate pyrophosphohydrolase family protein [bacterium]
MDLKEYQKLCKNTAKKYRNKEKEIMTWGLGICGEAGDVAGCIKKTYGQGDNQEKGTRENLGDTLWYIAMICNFYGWDLEDIMKENVKKLQKRHPKGFSLKGYGKITRKDWNE